MVTKQECIEVFNAMIRGTPVSFSEKLLPLYSEYLTEIKYENLDKIINLLIQNPQLIQNFLPEMVKYYCKKYCILSVVFNNKILLYYE
jgi:hypothetical protein